MATPIYEKIRKNLEAAERVPAVMPPCADVLLSLMGLNGKTPAELVGFFNQYFKFREHSAFPPGTDFTASPQKLDPELARCLGVTSPAPGESAIPKFPPHDCTPRSCVTLAGNRHGGEPLLHRLFVADLVWLFYMERLGTFQILGAILDDYATRGAFPISSHDVTSVVVEVMVREMQTGSSSYQRGRVTAYQRGLGWVTERGRELKVESAINKAFDTSFHAFVRGALGYYRDRRLAAAINATSTGAPSVATIVELVETIRLLRIAFDPFDYGRVYQDTLVGIVWVVSSLALLFELKDDVGIPTMYDLPREFVPAAYDLLVAKRPITPSEVNRYTTHVTCANEGRALALSIHGLQDPATGTISQADVTDWLNDPVTEGSVEAYRTAYRNLTGIDLAPPAPVNVVATNPATMVEQRA